MSAQETMSNNTDDMNDVIVDSLADHNRKVLEPFVTDLVSRFYKQIDIAAEEGVSFNKGITKKTADSILNEVLLQVQQDYQGIQFQERNILESTAYFAGMAIGYPRGLATSALKAIPLSAHFRAGMDHAEYKAEEHVATVCNVITLGMFSAKQKVEQVVENTKDTIASATDAITNTPEGLPA